jgi:uncharacterized membrane protein
VNIIDRGVNRFGKLRVASFFVMGIGLILFLLTPLFLWLWDMDTDIIGLLIVIIGLVLFIVGLILNKKPHGVILVLLIVLASILSLPLLAFIVTTVYFLITGKPLG